MCDVAMEAEVPSPHVVVVVAGAAAGMLRARSQASQSGCRGEIDQPYYREMTTVRATEVAVVLDSMKDSEGVDCWSHCHEIDHERAVSLADDGMKMVEALLADRHAARCIDQVEIHENQLRYE